eukprot:COSAG03_NODE_17289_length_379_cov_0.732143_2_plen_47_part_01
MFPRVFGMPLPGSVTRFAFVMNQKVFDCERQARRTLFRTKTFQISMR